MAEIEPLTREQVRGQYDQLRIRLEELARDAMAFADASCEALHLEASTHANTTWMHDNWTKAARAVAAQRKDIGHGVSMITLALAHIERGLRGDRIWPQYTPHGSEE